MTNKGLFDIPSFSFKIITANSIFNLQKTWVAGLKSQEKPDVNLYFTINIGEYKEGNYEVEIIMKNFIQITPPFKVTIYIVSDEKYPNNLDKRASFFLYSLSSKNRKKYNNESIIHIIKELGLFCSNEMIYDAVDKKN